ncbi:hypothetical protein BGZ58_008682 [Dissophora ornata]|nr:hypothetical protein BGZ58_008682 [Dissophora ornata]
MQTTQNIATKYNDIKDISLVDFLGVETEQTLPAHQIWKDKPTIVIVIRRPGCQFCREEAKIFHENRQTIEEAMGMKMVCIVHEKEGSDIFQNESWHGQVYFDPEKGFYKGLGILGGLLVVNAGNGGIAYEHIEKVWGDIAHADKVLEACSRVSGVPLSKETVAKAQEDHDALHQKMQQSSHATGETGAEPSGGACAPAAAPASGSSSA